MGLFDWVNYKTKCPHCGAELTGFQTKGAYNKMQHIEPWETDNMHTACHSCNAWLEYDIESEVEKHINIKKLEIKLRSITIDGLTMDERSSDSPNE